MEALPDALNSRRQLLEKRKKEKTKRNSPRIKWWITFDGNETLKSCNDVVLALRTSQLETGERKGERAQT